ncbi:MAG: Biopolymer transport protein ExbB [Lentisphaerae bacterium ADurb.BinA184]|nr:MAG: Biopolymer transport protein ExbB [Lentisphaerae bacterium ADurb.BinA184]
MITLILKGGMFMGPLLLCSIVGLAIVFDKWRYLIAARREADVLLARVDERVGRGDFDGVAAVCREHGGPLSEVFAAGVRKFQEIREEPNLDFVQQEVSKRMEDAGLANATDLERRLPLLGTIGNVAPLFGFAGTVTGMMRAFSRIAATANPNAQTVAAGIEEALITTAAGLMIAIPAVLAYNYFAQQIDVLNTRTEESATGLLDAIVMSCVKTGKRSQGNA